MSTYVKNTATTFNKDIPYGTLWPGKLQGGRAVFTIITFEDPLGSIPKFDNI